MNMRWRLPLSLAISLLAFGVLSVPAHACQARCIEYSVSGNRGVLLDEEGNPIPKAKLIVRDASPTAKEPAVYCARRGSVILKTYTDKHGKFRLEGIHTGKYFVTYMDSKNGESFLIDVGDFEPSKPFELKLFTPGSACAVMDVERMVSKPLNWGKF